LDDKLECFHDQSSSASRLPAARSGGIAASLGKHAAGRSLITRDQLFFNCRFRSRTPGPPPFCSMNSMPVFFISTSIAMSVA
jgi:hypothetical protein